MEPFTERWYIQKAAEKREKELVVIEAAKALHAKMNSGEFANTAGEQAGVWQAVEAYEEK